MTAYRTPYLDGANKIPTARLGGAGATASNYLCGDQTWKTPAGGAGNFGEATIPFAAWLTEDTITVTGQTSILATSKILCSIYAENDDIYAQDWRTPLIRNIVPGVGFDITLRSEIGAFKGGVKMNWTWSN